MLTHFIAVIVNALRGQEAQAGCLRARAAPGCANTGGAFIAERDGRVYFRVASREIDTKAAHASAPRRAAGDRARTVLLLAAP